MAIAIPSGILCIIMAILSFILGFMVTIAEQLTQLNATKQNFKTKFTAKGMDMACWSVPTAMCGMANSVKITVLDTECS